MNYEYVDSDEKMAGMIAGLKTAKIVAIDTEADSLHHYYEKVCLIQLTFDERNFIVDPLGEIVLDSFLEAICDKDMILHDAGYDLRMMRSTFGFEPRGKIFDTMLAGQLIGYQSLGLAAMLERFFDVSISKIGQRWDWSQRPLAVEKIRYAVCDTHYLPKLAEILADRLEKLGRLGWHEESCERMKESATQEKAAVDPDKVWRIKGSRHLDPFTLTMLQYIWHWRETQSQKADLPPFKIMINSAMIAFAGWTAGHPNKPLGRGPRLPRNCVGTRLRLLEKAIAKAHSLPESEWQQHRKAKGGKKPSASAQHIAEAIKESCSEIGESLELAPQIIAPRAAINSIASARPGTLEEIMDCSGLTNWQSKLIEEAAKNSIAKFHPK